MPMPPDFDFECPPLSPEECEQYKQQALQNIQDLVEKADMTNPRYEWKRIADEAEVEIFRGMDPYRPTSATLFCSTVDVAGTLDEVTNFFRTRTRDETKEMIDRTDVAMLDIANLYTIHESQDLDIRVQWLLEKTPFDVVVKNRDFCFLKCTHFVDEDQNGRRTWARSLNSIHIPCCPEMPNIVRGVQYGSGLVCRESARPGYIELKEIVHCDLRGTLLNAIKEKVAMDLCSMIKGIDTNLRENRLIETPFLSGEQFVELSSRQRCYLCKRNFGFFRKKKHCFKCGEVVCSQCGPKWHIKVAGTPVKVRACTTCSLLSRSSIGIETETAMSPIITPSSAASTDVWRLADGEDDSDDDGVSFITDSSMSHYSVSTGGRPTFDHSPDAL
ncbi:hypothetical protein Ae201684_013935 [Aphanomyces euteiches]|uniref:FYVE-type domain-containing protein n=1 Tax=Aphanomyces euteiches TaxID=100861 RepID=A0A6G0WLD2_9STRA|nr:hypothetical protein Ae201684_013915 [Aphanomyces euteiches]KAF0728107.1 hypothetical protein Ae201684_013935 [Aphanomyces euteiches]KAH9149702.1 hypothetical protein AeRB84_007298 [Aphanomyces euteiches]